MTELQLQAECTTWFQNNMRQHRGKFRRVKNETDSFVNVRSRIAQGVQNKATGIKKGTWDAFLITNPMCWIEFKVGNNGLTKEQEEFMKMGELVGWKFRVVYNLEHFIETCNEFLK